MAVNISLKRNQTNGQADLKDVLWEQINLIFKEHDFPQMKLVQSENKLIPDYSSLAETVLSLFNYVSSNEKSYRTKIEKMKNALETSQEALNKLNEKYQELKLKLKKRNQKIEDLIEKLTKFNDLDNILKAIHTNAKNKSREIFKQVMHREYDPDLEADLQVMSVILLYEHSKISTGNSYQKSSTEEEEKSSESSTDNSILPLILNKLEVKSPSQALEVIQKMQQVILIIPNIESFISSIYKVLFTPEPAADISINMEQILPTIISMKIKLISLERFRRSICENFELDVNNPDEVVIHKSEALNHFNRLFKTAGNESRTVEEVFIFVHEMKKFLKIAREILNLGDQIAVGSVLEKIIKVLSSKSI
ncbi:unnamed protein product [Blepharisma stoltei]|uniref:Centrosomal protein of 70 kDa n=1 Tax=Blepharisma stoltei TaxID=1481888 RepID=A0AAU9JZP1_9CILI|nr:unnamed protein product [Blepharisma stoltei]